ncbi:hypothetical protein SDC9_157394 [bioreactor metagenome]|uniref:Uncharacterized protein n=1 Tax=bioreactor metagenome TaxID=1076179 RepID=A0A645F745_9ZZZZ
MPHLLSADEPRMVDEQRPERQVRRQDETAAVDGSPHPESPGVGDLPGKEVRNICVERISGHNKSPVVEFAPPYHNAKTAFYKPGPGLRERKS